MPSNWNAWWIVTLQFDFPGFQGTKKLCKSKTWSIFFFKHQVRQRVFQGEIADRSTIKAEISCKNNNRTQILSWNTKMANQDKFDFSEPSEVETFSFQEVLYCDSNQKQRQWILKFNFSAWFAKRGKGERYGYSHMLFQTNKTGVTPRGCEVKESQSVSNNETRR